MFTTIGLATLTAIAGCARPTPPPVAPVAAPETAAPAPEPTPEPMPTECESETSLKRTKVCLPPEAFAKKLCGGIYPEVALTLFAKGTPWTRIWLAGDVEAWNAAGGRTHPATLAFDEEVIVLSRRGPRPGATIVVSGASASYDVLRWDGTCVSVMEGEVTTRRPPSPKAASIPWGRLDEPTRRALLASPKVKTSHESLDKACGSGASPADKKTCEKADQAFAKAVASFVRGGVELPPPSRRP
ncbi:MAG TPA: hypothetical protein VM925_25125 [Labilithrix sp.]|nr:hypothetical protein [Labilithrix sp.]